MSGHLSVNAVNCVGGGVGALLDAVHESHPAADTALQRDRRGGVLNGLGGDGLSARGQVGLQLQVGLVDHGTHAAVRGQARTVALTRAGGAHPVKVTACRCRRSRCGTGGQPGQRNAGHENGQSQTTNHDEFPPTPKAADDRWRCHVSRLIVPGAGVRYSGQRQARAPSSWLNASVMEGWV